MSTPRIPHGAALAVMVCRPLLWLGVLAVVSGAPLLVWLIACVVDAFVQTQWIVQSRVPWLPTHRPTRAPTGVVRDGNTLVFELAAASERRTDVGPHTIGTLGVGLPSTALGVVSIAVILGIDAPMFIPGLLLGYCLAPFLVALVAPSPQTTHTTPVRLAERTIAIGPDTAHLEGPFETDLDEGGRVLTIDTPTGSRQVTGTLSELQWLRAQLSALNANTPRAVTTVTARDGGVPGSQA